MFADLEDCIRYWQMEDTFESRLYHTEKALIIEAALKYLKELKATWEKEMPYK